MSKAVIRVVLISLLSNGVLAIIKFLAGVYGDSYALLADATESAADFFASFVLYFGFIYSHKPADKNHPYGHGRLEPLVTFIVVAFLICSASLIVYKSIVHIITPHKTPAPFTLLVLGVLIIWKEILFRIVMNRAKKSNNTALKAEAWHHRSDALTSVAAFIGISIALFFGKGYESADDWAALLASFVIFYNAWHIFRPALGEMMDEQIHEDLSERIRVESVKVAGIIATEKLHIRKSGAQYYIDLHAMVKGELTVIESHKIGHDLEDHLLREIPEIAEVLVHIEPDSVTLPA